MTLEYFEHPSKSGETKQLIILLHGYGSHGEDLITLAPELAQYAPDAHFISPHAPQNFEGGGPAYQWYSLIDRSDESILEGAKWADPILQDFIYEQLDRFDLNFDSLAVIGFSQGAMMTMFSLLRCEERAAGLLCYSGFLVSPDLMKQEIGTKPPVLLVHGNEDVIVPLEAMEMISELLEEKGIDVEAHVRPQLGHGIDKEGVRLGGEFLRKIFS